MDTERFAALTAKFAAEHEAAREEIKKRLFVQIDKEMTEERQKRDKTIRDRLIAEKRAKFEELAKKQTESAAATLRSVQVNADEALTIDAGNESDSSAVEPLAGWSTRKHPVKTMIPPVSSSSTSNLTRPSPDVSRSIRSSIRTPITNASSSGRSEMAKKTVQKRP